MMRQEMLKAQEESESHKSTTSASAASSSATSASAAAAASSSATQKRLLLEEEFKQKGLQPLLVRTGDNYELCIKDTMLGSLLAPTSHDPRYLKALVEMLSPEDKDIFEKYKRIYYQNKL